MKEELIVVTNEVTEKQKELIINVIEKFLENEYRKWYKW